MDKAWRPARRVTGLTRWRCDDTLRPLPRKARITAMRYVWPDGKQSAAVLSFDFDAESGFLFREPEKAKRSLADLEERRFGPRVGVDRILRMLDRLRLRASFFIPGWTVVHHLPQCKRIRDAGHEIGAHGNVHEAVSSLDEPQEKAVMAEQLRILADQLGVKPAGYRSPSWDVNVWTPALLKAHGFRYDSSLMGNDVPYDVPTADGPLTEVPVQWIMDDGGPAHRVTRRASSCSGLRRHSARAVASAVTGGCRAPPALDKTGPAALSIVARRAHGRTPRSRAGGD